VVRFTQNMSQNTSSRDKIGKAAWNLISSAKDSTITNVASAIKEGKLTVDSKQAQFLQELIQQSIDQGYHRAYKSFMREVDSTQVVQVTTSKTKK